ncbi:unnamed protein product, partial [Porites evermanni]
GNRNSIARNNFREKKRTELMLMATQRKVVKYTIAVLLITGLLVVESSLHKNAPKGESEAKLEQNARHWIDALLDRVDLKHLKDEENLQLKRRIQEILTKRI